VQIRCFHYNRLLQLGWTTLPQWCVVPAPMKMLTKIYSFGISIISEMDPLTSHRRRASHVWWISPLAPHHFHLCPFTVTANTYSYSVMYRSGRWMYQTSFFISCLENHISVFWIMLCVVESLSCHNCSNQKLYDLRI